MAEPRGRSGGTNRDTGSRSEERPPLSIPGRARRPRSIGRDTPPAPVKEPDTILDRPRRRPSTPMPTIQPWGRDPSLYRRKPATPANFEDQNKSAYTSPTEEQWGGVLGPIKKGIDELRFNGSTRQEPDIVRLLRGAADHNRSTEGYPRAGILSAEDWVGMGRPRGRAGIIADMPGPGSEQMALGRGDETQFLWIDEKGVIHRVPMPEGMNPNEFFNPDNLRPLTEKQNSIRQASFRTEAESEDTPPYYPNLPPEEQISQMLWDRMLPSEKREPWLGKSNVEEWGRRVVQREKREQAALKKLKELNTDSSPRTPSKEESKPKSDLFWERNPNDGYVGPDVSNPLLDMYEFIWGGGAVQKAKELGRILRPPQNGGELPYSGDPMDRMFGGPADPRPEFLPDPNLGAMLELEQRFRPEQRRVQGVPQGFVDPQQDGIMFKLKKWIQENLVD